MREGQCHMIDQKHSPGQLAGPESEPLHPACGELFAFVPHARAAMLVDRQDINSVRVPVNEREDWNTAGIGRVHACSLMNADVL